MYKVLVAEDELLVRIGIRSLIRWEECGLELCAEVADGQKAWDMYETHSPDIVITDIRMPHLDGIEFIRRIRERDATVRVIIVTCLNDFDILREATQLGITGYVVKLTMTDDELNGLLERAKQELARLGKRSHAENALRQSAPEGGLKALIVGGMRPEEYWLTHGKATFGVCGAESPLIGAYVLIDDLENVKRIMHDRFGEHLRKVVSMLMGQLYEAANGGAWCELETGVYFTLSRQENFESVHRLFMTYLESMCTVYRLPDITNMRQLPDMCAQGLSEARALRFFAGNGQTLQGRATDAVKCAYLERAFKNPRHYFAEPAQLDEVAIRAGLLQYIVSQSGWRDVDYQTVNEATLPDIASLCEKLEEANSGLANCSKSVRDSVAYIQRHYLNGIDVPDIAGHVGYTANHMSGLFKREMGIGITQYINRLRVSRAKLLLQTSQKSIAEVAADSGFSSEMYFYRVFHQIMQCTPREFREKNKQE